MPDCYFRLSQIHSKLVNGWVTSFMLNIPSDEEVELRDPEGTLSGVCALQRKDLKLFFYFCQ